MVVHFFDFVEKKTKRGRGKSNCCFLGFVLFPERFEKGSEHESGVHLVMTEFPPLYHRGN